MDFLKKAGELFPHTQSLRRDFHKHPELGFREHRTAGIVAQELESLGLEVKKGVGKTGVVALLEGANSGPTLMLRFDMDALPIQEETGAQYASLTPGIMHACGHDGHTAIGLTVARILQSQRNELAGNIKFCFQPSEEGTNGEDMGGAEMMIQDGLLEAPRVNMSLGLHLWNEKPFGWMGISGGAIMAGAEIFHVRVTGRGGHAAIPHATVDPLIGATQIVNALQTIVSRNAPPLETAVVSVTSIHGGTAFNVIPQQVELEGTIRTFNPELREKVLHRFEQIIDHTAAAMGCQAEIRIKRITPALINDQALAESVCNLARRMLPRSDVDTSYQTMTAEDMAFIQEKVPGCYFFIGSADQEKHLDFGHHHPKFDFDERALVSASALMAAAAVDLLKGPGTVHSS